MSVAPLRETGFDPVVAGHTVFRRLLEATANPGAIVELDGPHLMVPAPRLAGACALLLAVLDDDVSVRVIGPLADSIAEYLRFNTGARSAPLGAADFVFVTGPTSGAQLSQIRERSRPGGATLIYAPETLSPTPFARSVRIALAGPTVSSVRRLYVSGIDHAEIDRLHSLGHTPPGVDLWLASGQRALAVIPRSTIWIREA